MWWGGQSKAKDVDSRAPLKSAHFSLPCLWRAEASLSGLSPHSTFIINLPVSPSSSAQPITAGPLRLLPVSFDAALVWLWCLYQHERTEDRVLIDQRGIMWLPASGGGIFFYICMFNSYFILLSGDLGPCFSQSCHSLPCYHSDMVVNPVILSFGEGYGYPRPRAPPSWAACLFLPLLISCGERLD